MDDVFVEDLLGCYVYLLWGEDNATPVYVGRSQNVLARLGQHMKEVRKRELVHRVQLIRCATRIEMVELEVRLIMQYQPVLNKQISPCKITGCGERSTGSRMCTSHRWAEHKSRH